MMAAKKLVASGGVHALRGFDYQGIVILEILLAAFELSSKARARPEGEDDLVVQSDENDASQFFQIKKPRESDAGIPTEKPWTLSDAAQELFPATMDHLAEPNAKQTWILGDGVSSQLRNLIDGAGDAATKAPVEYGMAVFLLARDKSKILSGMKIASRKKLSRWRPQKASLSGIVGDNSSSLPKDISQWLRKCELAGVTRAKRQAFVGEITTIKAVLPNILSRIELRTTHGSESEVDARVRTKLEQTYGLSAVVVSFTLLRNLRGFVNEVSKQPDRWLDADEFELQLRSVWPEMSPVRAPPPPAPNSLRREKIIAEIFDRAVLGPVAVIGISGSGKTTLASSLHAHSSASQLRVMYAEVRPTHRLRDVLAGIAIELRSDGLNEPFRAATARDVPAESVIGSFASTLGYLSKPVVIILDLVEGDCSDPFAEDLATFVRKVPRNLTRVVVFGQVNGLRAVNSIERVALSFPDPFDIPGFDFNEFVELAALLNLPADRQFLWRTYEHFSAGRPAGLPAHLAALLAGSSSRDALETIAGMPPAEGLRAAERARYRRVSWSARPAVDKISCFLLPFRRSEAEKLFPNDRIAAALRELEDLGLIRRHDADRFEMHEMVRGAIEEEVTTNVRYATHGALAEHYRKDGQIVAAILHLDRADRTPDAIEAARARFLAGQDRAALLPYVKQHRILSTEYVLEWMNREPLDHDAYLIPELLEGLGSVVANKLVQEFRAQTKRIQKDFRWGWLLVQSILACDSTKLYELILIGMECVDGDVGEVLDRILLGARRVKATVDERLLSLFDATPARGFLLAPFLLLRRDKESMQRVLSLWSTSESPSQPKRVRTTANQERVILETPKDIDAFIAALPTAKIDQMIASRSASFGLLSDLVWSLHRQLTPRCRTILLEKTADDDSLCNAMRVLAFVSDPDARKISKGFGDGNSTPETLARLLPILLPHSQETEDELSAEVLDASLPVERRFTAFAILSGMGVDLNTLYKNAIASDPDNSAISRVFAIQTALSHPFERAIPSIEEMIEGCLAEDQARIYAAMVSKFGELPGDNVTSFLTRMLASKWPRIRLAACTALQQRRAGSAFLPLVELLRTEGDPTIGQTAIVAAVASGAPSVNALEASWRKFPLSGLWRTILTGRRRICEESQALVTIATDPNCHWQHRHAAILASAQLPFECALAVIAPTVLAETNGLTIDGGASLAAHGAVAAILSEGHREVAECFGRGRTFFSDVFGEIFDTWSSASLDGTGTPKGVDLARWLFDELARLGFPNQRDAPLSISNAVHQPILKSAALRGLARAARISDIVAVIASADQEWLVLRALCQLGKVVAPDAELKSRLQETLNGGRWKTSIRATRVLEEISKPSERPSTAAAVPESVIKPHPKLTFGNVTDALRTGNLPNEPFALVDINEDQFVTLVRELAPVRDFEGRWVQGPAQPTFTAASFSVGTSRQESVERYAGARARIRPALVAANIFDRPIPWHEQLLLPSEHGADARYVQSLFSALAVKGDRDRLYAQLARHGSLIVPHIASVHHLLPLAPLIDERIVDFLARHVRSGNDGILEGLTWLANGIDHPTIDPILENLFARWVGRFQINKAVRRQHAENVAIWRSFHNLRTSRRFKRIRDYDLRLMSLLQTDIAWFHKNDVVRVVRESPRSYIQLETMLFRATPFEHFREDDVDRLDAAADALFAKYSP